MHAAGFAVGVHGLVPKQLVNFNISLASKLGLRTLVAIDLVCPKRSYLRVGIRRLRDRFLKGTAAVGNHVPA